MEINLIKRLPPCYRFDVEAMEGWLESMALNGRMLVRRSALWGRVTFLETDPTVASYRLIPLKNRGDDQPHPYLIQDMEKIGWEYVRKWDEFFIFRNLEDSPQEPWSSPETQAADLEPVKKRAVQSLLWAIFLMVCLAALVAYTGYSRLLLSMLCLKTGLVSLTIGAGACIWLLINPICNLRRLTTLQTRIRSGQGQNRHTDWQKHARRNRCLKIAGYAMVVVLCFSSSIMNLTEKYGQKPLSDFPGEPPFATLDELAPEDASVTVENFLDGYYLQGRGIFIPRVLHWWSGVNAVYTDDDYSTAGIMDVQYLEAPSPALALAMAKDLTRSSFRNLPLNIPFLEDIDVDYIAGGNFQSPRVIMAQGNHVLVVRFTMGDKNGNFTLENWLRKTAEKLR